MQPRAKNVGIAGIEVHFPQLYVSQADLEKHHQVSSGKYTIGLGQTNMSFVESYEDINSISLTVVQNLLEKYNIDPRNIGRLEVGTETLLDKSKSTKTVLMELFSKYGNNDIEGVTSLNACYGGTNALFNTVSWMQSESWDGRLGIVVAADIAVYAKGPARPTGGAGAIAILIGPDAPIVFENVRSTYITHAYDFYKPDASSEYPTVDGQLSVKCYHEAIEKCYLLLKEKYQMQGREHLNLDSADYFCFHSPFGKMVYRSFITLLNIDIKEGRLQAKAFDEKIQSIAQKLRESDINPENKAYNELVKSFWNKKTAPATYLSSELGNIYTGSLYAGLISLIADEKIQLENKKIMMFSYGSGLASSMFSFRVVADLKGIRRRLNITERLQKRTKIAAEVYEEIMDDRRNFFNKPNWTPKINLENLAEGTFYLKNVDDKYRRNYARKAKTTSSSLLSRNEVKNEEVDEKMLMKEQNPPEGAAVTRLKTVEKHLSTVTEKNLSASEESEENKKVVNDALVWTGFYKKTFKERLDHIKKIDPNVNVEILKSGGLSVNVADLMVENCIGVLSLPLGLSPNFLINDKFYTVPMCIEEPSVIAAASSAAKFIADKGKGFKTHSTASVMRGQIQVLDVNTEIASVLIDSNKKSLITNANLACASMVHRGGGVKDITTKILQSKSENSSSVIGPMLIVEFQIDVCEAMGANIINTVAEALSPYIIELVGGRVGLKILSNLCPERRAISYFEIPVKEMAWKSSTGKEVATKMLEAFTFAKLDVFRAVTHNKGILNGIDAVAIATGQDWRAIESAAHAYSFYKYGTYHPLTQYSIVTKNNEEFFTGQLEIPVAIGSKGGVLESNPIYKNNFRLLGFPSARTLAEVFVSVGLAQNFAALRAMAIEGIQKGHMNLHARNIALSAGIPQGLVSDAAEFMKSRGKISKDSANAYLEAIELFSELRFPKNSQNEARNMKQLSTFYIDIPIENLEEPLVFNLALDCTTDKPVHLSMQKEHLTRGGNDNPQMIELWNVIFGNKGYEWFISFISELEPISLTSVQSAKTSGLIRAIELSYKLKITGILINLVTFNMANLNQEKTRQVLEATRDWVQSDKKQDISLLLKGETLALRYGLSLLSELIKIFYFNIDQMLLPEEVKKALIDELFTIISSAFSTYLIWEQANSIKSFDFKEFLNQRRKRMSATLILLCDCLLLKTVEITPQAIQEIKHLGEIYEIEGTMARDLARWSFSKPVENNLFTYWLMMKGKFMGGDQIEVQQEFIKEISAIIGEKKKYLFDKFGDRTRKSYEVTKELIANHYLRKATKPKL